MDMADLRLVDAIAERGSFTAAAAHLRMSQPSVSARVARVERTLGAPLFIRDPRGARLTEAGTASLGYVRRCLRLLEDGASAAAAQTSAPPWRIGLPASYAPALTPLLLTLPAAGGRPMTVSTGHSRDLRTAVLDGRLDLAVAHPGPLPAGLSRRHLLDTPILAVAHPGTDPGDPGTGFAVHSWATDAEVVVTDLLGHGVDRRRIALVSPATTALALASHHGYIAVVPELAATDELRRGTVAHIPMTLPATSTALDWVHPATPNPALEQFFELQVGS